MRGWGGGQGHGDNCASASGTSMDHGCILTEKRLTF